MVWLMRKEPQSFSSLLPFPGDFNFAHMLMAMHVRWWENSDLMDCDQQRDMCRVNDRGLVQRGALQSIPRLACTRPSAIVGIVAYMKEVMHPDILLQRASEGNKGSHEFSDLHQFYLC